jgi:hypothetical protein
VPLVLLGGEPSWWFVDVTGTETPGVGNPGAPTTLSATDVPSLGQISPVGTHPSAGVLFLGALLWAAPADAADVLAVVRDDDMATPSQEAVLAAVRGLVAAGTPPGPQLVLAALRRAGTLKHFAARDLQDATTSGAQPMALREYAAAVVSVALRRRIESAGSALIEAADVAVEDDLTPLVVGALTACLTCAGRLAKLRGEWQ